jgi:predicted nucleotidyltransferase component of viral defense system
MDYVRLYAFQDEILEKVFNLTKNFYLTGGTCLNRFYYQVRYSDDLDFFSLDEYFVLETKRIIENLQKDYDLILKVNAQNFKMLYVNDLKVDFVDTHFEPHFGEFLKKDGMILDSKENIFINKITAILGRDEAKDVIDFYFLKKFENYDLNEYIKKANEKMIFEKEDFFYRLKTFPKERLKKIAFVDKKYFEDIYNNYNQFLELVENELF